VRTDPLGPRRRRSREPAGGMSSAVPRRRRVAWILVVMSRIGRPGGVA
jgi:hypothetical protein